MKLEETKLIGLLLGIATALPSVTAGVEHRSCEGL